MVHEGDGNYIAVLATRKLAQQKGMSPKELLERCGVPQGRIELELDEEELSLITLNCVCDSLGMNLQDLFKLGRSEKEKREREETAWR